MHNLFYYPFIISLLLSATITAQMIPIHRISHTIHPSQISSPAFHKLYAVTATLDSHEGKSSKSSVNMLLGLYTSTSLFSKGCIGFDEYELPVTTSENRSRTYSFLNFQATGPKIEADLSLDSTYWRLSGLAVLADQCSSKSDASFQDIGLAGIIGMGFYGASAENYLHDSTIFSVYLSRDGNSGQLAFSNNISFSKDIVPVAVLSASPNLHVYNVTNITLSHGEARTIRLSMDEDDYYSIVFDLNADAIGLPEAIFSGIMETLDQLVDNLDCSSETYRPECTYNGNLQDLPTVNIEVSGTNISIVPEIYVVNASSFANGTIEGKITLNLKAVSKSSSNENYVGSVFDSTIILDSAFMTHYYTVFNTDLYLERTNITLYLANHNPSLVINSGQGQGQEQKVSHALHFALLSVFVVLIIAAITYFVFVRRSRAKAEIYEQNGRELPVSEYFREGRGLSLLSQSQL